MWSRTLPREEYFYQRLVEDYLGGGHMRLSNGFITDVTTSLVHAEVKRWSDSIGVNGQLKFYNYVCYRPQLQAYLFEDMVSEEKMQQRADFLLHEGIDVFSFEFKDKSCDINVINYHTKEIMYTHLPPPEYTEITAHPRIKLASIKPAHISIVSPLKIVEVNVEDPPIVKVEDEIVESDVVKTRYPCILHFGEEDTSHITDEIFTHCIANYTDSIEILAKLIYFNDDIPENQNIRRGNSNANIRARIYYFWQVEPINVILDVVIVKLWKMIYAFFEKNRHKPEIAKYENCIMKMNTVIPASVPKKNSESIQFLGIRKRIYIKLVLKSNPI